MILGASHVVLTTANAEEDEKALVEQGWKRRFLEEISGRAEKAPFLAAPSAGEEIILLDRPGYVALELIAYSYHASAGAIACLEIAGEWKEIAAASSIPASFLAAGRRAGDSQLRLHRLPGGEPFLVPAMRGTSRLLHRVRDFQGVRDFWEGALGFEATGPEERTVLGREQELTLQRPFAHWSMRIRLVEDPEADASASSLDALGVRCLSFIASDLAVDRQKLTTFPSVRTTGPMRYSIAGKSLAIEIFLVPGGLHVELLQTMPI